MKVGEKVPELLKTLWREFEFKPNDEQAEAILHADGPLFLPAGPGSGKTRVLLWRTVNLITTHGVRPEEIFLSTFTEKAALQLRNGLRTLLSAVSEKTGKPYDTVKMADLEDTRLWMSFRSPRSDAGRCLLGRGGSETVGHPIYEVDRLSRQARM